MENIQHAIDGYFTAWNEAFKSKDADLIRNYMSKEFIGYWAHSGLKEPDSYGYEYDLEAVLKQMGDAEKSFEPQSTTKRKNGQEYLVLGRETSLINGEEYSAQCMFVWRKENGDWRLIREYIELER
ncbi:nuclear transport factor 2 family protein [Alteribacter aurantiacus]|uniref:nuclear transport factor 2 family protein n=1 Tax=Alteribacter aurantiacus TaxID=254410 RepID=UPI00041DA8D9|nr:nuclear transport factor 2 family protein [Alteribacter aurantiacus]